MDSAKVLADNMGTGRKENILYTAQQSIEKALKAVICWRELPVPMSHSIELILDRMPDDLIPPRSDLIVELTDIATMKRYNEGSDIISEEDVTATLATGEEVLAWALDQLK